MFRGDGMLHTFVSGRLEARLTALTLGIQVLLHKPASISP